MSTFLGTGWSSNSIVWKRWLLYNKRQWLKKKRTFMSKTSGKLRWWGWLIGCCKNVHCMQVSHVMSMQLFAATIKMTCYVLHLFALCQWYIFSRIERWFAYICTRVFNQFRNNKIVENYVNGKYRKEHSTVDKVGCRKLVARKSCFGVELVSS